MRYLSKQKWSVGLGALVVAIFATSAVEQAIANTATFSWTMDWREVNGAANGKFYFVDAGNLMIDGKIWVRDKRRAGPGGPADVKVEVIRRVEDGKGISVCSLAVTPSSVINERRAFSKSCGPIAAGTYSLVIAKAASSGDGDGWHNQGSGTLATTK